MNRCYQCPALLGAESQVLRHSKTVTDLIRLLRNIREDGGLGEAQCQTMDRLVERNEAVMAGLIRGDAATDMLREIAVEIGPITDLDRETFEPEDPVSIDPPFGLLCRIAAHFREEGQCACCGPADGQTRALGVDCGPAKR